MIGVLTRWRARHAEKPEASLFPLTYIEVMNLFSLLSWTIHFAFHRNLMDTALANTPLAFLSQQGIWTSWMVVTLFCLFIGYWAPQIRIKAHTFYINGRTIGLLMSTGLWTMYSSFLWFLAPDSLFNVTYTVLAILVFIIGTKVLAYER